MSGLLAAALLTVASLPLSAQHGEGPEAAGALARERALADALHERDRSRLEQLLADDYVLRSSPDIGRATWIRNALALCWGDRSDITDFRAREHGPVVVTSFVLTFYVDPESCGPAVLRSLITDIWTAHDGTWRLRVRHSGPVAAPGDIAGQYGLVPELPPTWDVQGELSLVGTTGNASTRTLGLAGDMAHRSDRATTRVRAAFLTSEADAQTRARSVTGQGRHGYRLTDRVEVFGRVAYARDRFAGIENRAAADAGIAYTAPLPAPHTLTAEGGVGHTAEYRLDAADLRFAAATGSLIYGWRITPGTELKDDVAVIADLQSGRNWRATNALSVTVTLTRLLSLKGSHALEYRNLPVPGFRRLDTRSSVALVLRVQRRRPLP